MQQKVAMKLFCIAIGLSMAMPVFAESAPVYDADTMQQDIDASIDQGQELPLPPAPGQESSYAPGFVPATAAPTPSSSPSVVMASGSTDQRLRRLEDQVKKLQTDSSSARIEALQQEVQTLRGQVDELTHQLQQAQTQQKTMYADLDKRVEMSQQQPAASVTKVPAESSMGAETTKPTTAMSKATAANKSTKALENTSTKPAINKTSAAAPPASTNQQPDVAEEQQIYQTAYNLIKGKKYNDAISALQGMLKKYPTGQFASNAHYWLGELFGLVGKNEQALTEFNIVVKNYSSSPRVSDAQLKVGLIYAAQSKWSDAKSAFKRVINQYPGSAPAKLAATQLKQIKEAGH